MHYRPDAWTQSTGAAVDTALDGIHRIPPWAIDGNVTVIHTGLMSTPTDSDIGAGVSVPADDVMAAVVVFALLSIHLRIHRKP